jgi:FkbM family methyltransferase
MSEESITYDVYALNWNEARLLPLFFEYYKTARKIFIYDNESDDNSKEITQRYNRDFITFSTGQKFDDITHKNLKNSIWKNSIGHVDYVIVQDLDEFVHFKKYPNDLVSGFKELRERNIDTVNLIGYGMICTDKEFDDILNLNKSILSIYHGYRDSYYDKCLIFNPNVIKEINYGAGAHYCIPIGKNVKSLKPDDIYLLHCKHIGIDYEFNRRKQLRDRLSDRNKEQNLGIHYTKNDQTILKDLEQVYNNRKLIIKEIHNELTTVTNPIKNINFLVETFGRHDAIGYFVLNNQVWEPKTSLIINKLSPNKVFLDIGTNIGLHSLTAYYSNAKKVYSFECNPNTLKKLKNNFKLNNLDNERVKIFDKAVSNEENKVWDFFQINHNVGASYIVDTHITPDKNMKTFQVSSIVLDNVEELNSINEEIVIKMDVEGHELNALQGMTKILSNKLTKYLIIEINPTTSTVEILIKTIEYIQSYNFNKIYLCFIHPRDPWAGPKLNIDSNIFDYLESINLETIKNHLLKNHTMDCLFVKS